MLVVLCLGQFLTVASLGALNIALPSIRADLGASFEGVQWTVILYQIGYATTLVLGGRLGDIFGRSPLFILGVGTFAVASGIGMVSNSVALLAASRLIQGIAGGLASPQSLALLHGTFDGAQRRAAFSVFAMIGGGAFLIGQLLTGLLIKIDPFGLTWRASLLFNFVVGIVTTVMAWRVLGNVRQARRPGSLDVVGSALMIATALLLLVPLIEGNKLGWPPLVFVVLATALPVGYSFVRYEASIRRRGRVPLVDTDVFHTTTMRLGLAILIVFSGLTFPYFLFLTITLQSGFELDPLGTALATSPVAVGFFVTSLFVPRLMVRLGRRLFAVSAVVTMLGVVGTSATFMVGDVFRPGYLLVPLIVLGAGQSLTLSPALQLCLEALGSSSVGTTSGAVQTVQQILGPLHIALFGALYFAIVGTGIRDDDYVVALNSLVPILFLLAVAMFALHFWVPRDWPVAQPPKGPIMVVVRDESPRPPMEVRK